MVILKWFGWAFLSVIVLCASVGLWVWWGIAGARWFCLQYVTGCMDQPDKLGQVGDLFGGANALLSSFAVIGVAIAATFQIRAFRLAAKQHVQQSFEPLFFELLKRFSETRKDLETTGFQVAGVWILKDMQPDKPGAGIDLKAIAKYL